MPLLGCIATVGTTVKVGVECTVDKYYNGKVSWDEVASLFVLNTGP